MFKCGICGKEFDITNVNEYVEHVKNCALNKKSEEENKRKAKLEKLKEVNKFIEDIKDAEAKVDELKVKFYKKYPKEYETNFKKEILEKEPKTESYFTGKINDNEYDNIDDFLADIEQFWNKENKLW